MQNTQNTQSTQNARNARNARKALINSFPDFTQPAPNAGRLPNVLSDLQRYIADQAAVFEHAEYGIKSRALSIIGAVERMDLEDPDAILGVVHACSGVNSQVRVLDMPAFDKIRRAEANMKPITRANVEQCVAVWMRDMDAAGAALQRGPEVGTPSRPWLGGGLWQDMKNNPGEYAIKSLVTLALGAGLVACLFSIVCGVILGVIGGGALCVGVVAGVAAVAEEADAEPEERHGGARSVRPNKQPAWSPSGRTVTLKDGSVRTVFINSATQEQRVRKMVKSGKKTVASYVKF